MPTIAIAENAVTSIDWKQNDLYRFFALVFAPPTPECFNFLVQPTAPMALCDLWKRLKCEGEFQILNGSPATNSTNLRISPCSTWARPSLRYLFSSQLTTNLIPHKRLP